MKRLKQWFCKYFHVYYQEFIEPTNKGYIWYQKCHMCGNKEWKHMDAGFFSF